MSGAAGSLRVAAIMDTAILSGPARQLTEVARALESTGVHITVITFQRRGRTPSPFPAHLEQAGVECIVIPERGTTDVGVLSRLKATLDVLNPHIVQTHSYRPAALVTALQVMRPRRPWIAFFHGATAENKKVRFYNWLDRRLVRFADRVVVMSRAEVERLRRLGNRVRLLHNAVITKPATQELDASLLPDYVSHPVLGVIGRLSSEKGIDVLLRAVRLLRDRGVACSLVVAGDGPEHGTLVQLTEELGLSSSVHFLGVVHPIVALYPRLDVVVISSHTEGLPNVLLEALGADRPVVATRVGAIPEVLTDPDAGELVDPGSPIALADGIGRILGRLDDARARAARREAVNAFSLERRAQAHRALYDDVLREEASVA